MARISKAPKKKRAVLVAKDYQYPGERMLYLQAMGAVWLLFLIIAGVLLWQALDVKSALFKRHQAWVIALLYPTLSIMGLNYLSQRARKKQLKELGAKAKVMRTNRPELFKLVADEAALLCVKEPELYVIDDDVPYLYSVPGKKASIIMSSRTLEVLRPEEVAAAVAHEMGHIKTGHVAVDLAITAIRSSNPLVQVVVLPVTMMSFLMRGWLDIIDYTADRCSLLVVLRQQVCTAAMVKLAAAATHVTKLSEREQRRADRRRKKREEEAKTDRDAAADEAEKVLAQIAPEELDAYLAGGGEVTDDPIQVERAFKISRFIQQQHNLGERIKHLGDFIDSDEGEAALAKMEEIRAQLPGAQSASG